MAHHGNTPAAWAGVVTILIGFLIGGIGLVAGVWLVFWIGVVVAVLGPVVGKILQKIGFGAESGGEQKTAAEVRS